MSLHLALHARRGASVTSIPVEDVQTVCSAGLFVQEGLLRSVRSRSPLAVELTVSAIKLTFDSAAGAGPSCSYTRYC